MHPNAGLLIAVFEIGHASIPLSDWELDAPPDS
jgi:hypothetical protein